jgi:hypothetical protein
MPSLSRDLRRCLQKAISGENGARQIAEDGAERSLHRLGVDKHEPHTSLTPEERTLRNRLRAHGRQLGDKRDTQRGNQTITHLKQAVAYEHWHRMLFARYLAENDLLLHPDHGVSLSLDEVKQLALTRNCDWIALAADYAQRMLLSAVFSPEDPALRVPIPAEKRLELEGKLNSLPREVFLADDSLGWVYQFWQEDAKDVVNRSEVKIGADELAPVTQLFTEDYMVLFLLENTLGAWWAARHGSPDLPGYQWTYLRLKKNGTPAVGSFPGWPDTAREIRILDPCMGSGHFLTFALPILARMRVAEESIELSDAIKAVLRENLFGLELDGRCSQIAAFNLALTAWKLGGKHIELPAFNLACSGLGINAKEEEWVKLAGTNDTAKESLQRLYAIFEKAPTLGSLIDPKSFGKQLFSAGFAEVVPLLETALGRERQSDEGAELAVAAQGLLAAAGTLASEFTLVCTNVPYLGRGKQNDALKEFCERAYPLAKADLATCFIERCHRLCSPGGTCALVSPQNWLFLPGYTAIRKQLLTKVQFDAVVRLGANAFQDMNFWAATTALTVTTANSPSSSHEILGVDASSSKDQAYKKSVLRGDQDAMCLVRQASQLENPDARISMELPSEHVPLSNVAITPQGMKTGDDFRFRRRWWEINTVDHCWRFLHGAPDATRFVDGSCFALNFEGESEFARPQGQSAWGKQGVVVKLMGGITAARYFGDVFDSNVTAIVPRDQSDLPALWAYVSSPDFASAIRSIEQSVKVNNASVGKVPFDIRRWRQVALERYPSGLPVPILSDATQWLFSGYPNGCEHALQVAVARLLGYKWPRQLGLSFPEFPSLGPDGLEPHADDDGIVCLSSLSGDSSAAERLRPLLATAYGDDWSADKLRELLGDISLEHWLRDRFFEEHCSLFHDRPFIWHVWDGRQDGFHALLNYHRLDRRNLEKLIYSYLGDWLTRQRQDVSNGVEGADTKLAAAEHLQGELERILTGLPPYDIFVRWKPLSEQPIGWEPDLNDGVRINIRPWIIAAKLYKATKTGILRFQPNIKYPKDRGKEPFRDRNEFPWFKSSPDRVNDRHLTLEEKKAARGIQ